LREESIRRSEELRSLKKAAMEYGELAAEKDQALNALRDLKQKKDRAKTELAKIKIEYHQLSEVYTSIHRLNNTPS